ncbi:MAG: LysM peptidoglycan-binding domain-containing protein [Verrucomicrobiota bacterium]
MNDELLDYSPEKDIDMDREMKKATPARGGSKLSTILLIVLGVHLLVIIGVGGFHLLRGNKDTAKTPEVAAQATDPALVATDSLNQPLVETEHPAVTEEILPTSETVKTSTPSATDPVWAVEKTPATVISKSFEVAKAPEKPALISAIKEISAESVKKALPVTAPQIYTVAKGDTLTKIARKLGVSVADLRKENKLSSDLLKIGQKLDVPGAKSTAVVSAPSAKTETATGFRTYTVAKGDTLSKIARLFNTTPAKLVQLNGMENPNKLRVGMELKVPTAGTQQNASMQSAPKPFRAPVSNTDLAMLRNEENM